MNQLQSKISGSRDQGIRKARRASKTLPRLNIRSARTKALLDGADSDCSAEARMKSPVSSCTLVTAPCTPLRQDSEDDLHEFPESTGTPEIQVSFDNMVLNPVNNSLSSSSLNSRQAERRMAQAHRRKIAAIAEKEYWKSCIKVAVAQDGSKSVRVAQKLCNLGNALLTCKVSRKVLMVSFFCFQIEVNPFLQYCFFTTLTTRNTQNRYPLIKKQYQFCVKSMVAIASSWHVPSTKLDMRRL